MDAGEQGPALSAQAEKENIGLAAPSSQPHHPHPAAAAPQGQARPLCRFYSQGRHCHWGKRCRFLHQRSQADEAKQALSTLENKPPIGADSQPEQGQGPGEPQPVASGAQDSAARQETCQALGAFRSGQSREQLQHKQPQQQQHQRHHHQLPQHGKQQQQQHQHNQEKPQQQQQHQQHQQHPRPPPPRQQPNRKPCRYFLSGYCAMEDRCRFAHPDRFPPVTDQHPLPPPPSTETNNVGANHVRPSPRPRVPVGRPQPPGQQQEVKLSELTEDLATQLRSTELQQLTKRFPREKLIVQEREDGQVTYYRATVQPTDPDWPFDLKDLDIMVCFPDNYPQEVFTIEVPLDQDLPSVMGRHVQQASTEWLQAKHATNQLMGKVELLFRPFLRWLDRSMERLFTEGARKLKKDVEAERAGIQFVPYEQLQAAVLKQDPQFSSTSGPDASPDSPTASEQGGLEDRDQAGAGSDDDEEEDEDEEDEEDEDEEEDEEGNSRKVENVKSGERRKGTEVKLLGLRLGEGTATVVARQLTVSLQCSRCKVASDLTLSGRLACTAQCEKCGAGISAAFRPSMLHAYSDVLGYLDLNGVVPVDLVLQEAELAVGCLNCNQEDTVQNVAYGQNKETNCQQCHSKLSIFVESTRFQLIQPHTRKPTGQSTQPFRRHRDPAIQGGKPLPDKGACRHYKQSHRWLRFPCCGRAYPCDVCHDEDQDHPMELATRMICGHCAKEQPFSNGRPCVSCGGLMTRLAHSSHWEGGLGCRNKVKMNRNDRQKYANTNKTISRKSTAAKK
ncbi:uncharacterized protein si:dkey-24l11.2 [Engraulis encrasicolus]|uniref:uncharacterized protein si:dkey-24l11.2 n=1 Tax=Engraulis encrasicolus TaxID=184585 RepID=UPI002FCF3612